MPDVIPTGSQPPKEEIPEGTTDNKPDNKPDDTVSEKLLGKFNSPEEMATSYKELEDTLGRQGTELGSLRKQIGAMSADKAEAEEQLGQPLPNFEELRSTIEDKVEEGEISVSEGMTQMAALVQQETEAALEDKFTAYDQKRSADDQYNKFIDTNPDFLEMEQNGALADEMATNPMHDKFSAYFAVRAKIDATAAYEKGKEDTLKISKGAEGTRLVLSKPGGEAREVVAPKKGMNDSDKIAGMMSVLQVARGN